MQRVAQFSFRVNRDERQAIADLAARLQRSQSDAVRFVVIEAIRQLSQLYAGQFLFPLQEQEINQRGGMNVSD